MTLVEQGIEVRANRIYAKRTCSAVSLITTSPTPCRWWRVDMPPYLSWPSLPQTIKETHTCITLKRTTYITWWASLFVHFTIKSIRLLVMSISLQCTPLDGISTQTRFQGSQSPTRFLESERKRRRLRTLETRLESPCDLSETGMSRVSSTEQIKAIV